MVTALTRTLKISAIVALLLILLSITLTTTWIIVTRHMYSGTFCTNLPPGVTKMVRGVDITTLDINPIETFNTSGLRSRIIHFTCRKGKSWTSPDGTEYQLPDQIWQMTSNPGGWMFPHVSLLTDSSDIKEWMNITTRVEGFLPQYAFSASNSYIEMEAGIINSSKFIEDVYGFESATRVDFVNEMELLLNPFAHVRQYLKGTFESNRNGYESFIRKYGTHYFSSANFGGLIRTYMETAQQYVFSKSESEITNDAKASFLEVVSLHGGHVSVSTSVSDDFRRATSVNVLYYGGDTNLLQSGGIQQWQPTVGSNPWLFSGTLRPISDFITDENKRDNMIKAVNEHVFRSYLEELLRVTVTMMQNFGNNSLLNILLSKIETMNLKPTLVESEIENLGNDVKYQVTTLIKAENERRMYLEELLSMVASARQKFGNVAILNNLVNRIETMKQKRYLVENEVEDLGNDVKYQVIVPSWFLENTQLCYNWWPDGDGGQCGGGAHRLLCAKPNARTPVYRDDTDRRGGGCRMQWGVMSSNYPSWFSSVTVCFRWYPDGDGGQCGGGAARQLFAPLNQYTGQYRDDTDRRGGGCQMSWKIGVPSSAPLWLKNTQLCYYWYPDGDGGQCSGPSRTLCARADQWTVYYRDDTDRRGGGCRMSWGLSVPL